MLGEAVARCVTIIDNQLKLIEPLSSQGIFDVKQGSVVGMYAKALVVLAVQDPDDNSLTGLSLEDLTALANDDQSSQ